jgi:hypothetical protein
MEAFTEKEAWDLYLLVSYLLRLWKSTQSFVNVFINTTYADDAAVIVIKSCRLGGLPAQIRKTGTYEVYPVWLLRMRSGLCWPVFCIG